MTLAACVINEMNRVHMYSHCFVQVTFGGVYSNPEKNYRPHFTIKGPKL